VRSIRMMAAGRRGRRGPSWAARRRFVALAAVFGLLLQATVPLVHRPLAAPAPWEVGRQGPLAAPSHHAAGPEAARHHAATDRHGSHHPPPDDGPGERDRLLCPICFLLRLHTGLIPPDAVAAVVGPRYAGVAPDPGGATVVRPTPSTRPPARAPPVLT
jgi:hypothetical protein